MHDKKPLVSIIIPTLNEEAYIGKALRAIRSQKYRRYEVIVVDGLSKDKTVEIARKYADKVVVRKSNISQARNLGVKLAKGDILVFLDADTILPPNHLLNLLKHYEEKRVIGVRGYIFVRDGLLGRLYSWLACKLQLLLKTINCQVVQTCCCSYRKEVFEKLKFNEELEIGEDYELSTKARCLGKIKFATDLVAFISARRAGNLKVMLFYTMNAIFLLFFKRNISKHIKKIFY